MPISSAFGARFTLRIFCVLVFLFLLSPTIILVLTSFTAGDTVAFPPTGYSVRWYAKILAHLEDTPGVKGGLSRSLFVSLEVAAAATLISVLAGVSASYALFKYPFPGAQLLKQYFLLPVICPQLVTGIALLVWFTEAQVMNPLLRLILAHAILTLPYITLTVSASLEACGTDLEEAAIGLGASPVRAFLAVTAPLIGSAIGAGAIFAFIVSFNTFTLSYFLYSGPALPLPIWIFEYMTYFQDPTLAALSTVVIAITALTIVVFGRLIGLGPVAEDRILEG
jgi:putative spermidine/putrescine transport system permease protein